MDSNPQEPTGARFPRRLACFYASTFMALGVQLPFLPVWFAAKGLDAQDIGVVLASPMILRLFAIPMATRTADRRDALRAVIIVSAAAALAGFAALSVADGVIAIGVLYALAATAFMPLFVLSDVYALRGLAMPRRSYGPIRLWGSAAFIVATVGAGQAFDAIAVPNLIWLVVAAVTLCLFAAWALPPLEARTTTSAPPPSPRVLLRNPAFVTIAAAASLIQGSHALYYGFATIAWQSAGFSGATIGLFWSLGVLAEIVLFALSARLPATLTPGMLILIGASGAVLRWTAMGLDPPAAALPFLQCLHGLSFGATHLGTLAFVARLAPAGLTATAQGYLSVILGLTMAAATGLSGLLYAQFAVGAYGAMALIAAAGFLAALAARRLLFEESL